MKRNITLVTKLLLISLLSSFWTFGASQNNPISIIYTSGEYSTKMFQGSKPNTYAGDIYIQPGDTLSFLEPDIHIIADRDTLRLQSISVFSEGMRCSHIVKKAVSLRLLPCISTLPFGQAFTYTLIGTTDEDLTFELTVHQLIKPANYDMIVIKWGQLHFPLQADSSGVYGGYTKFLYRRLGRRTTEPWIIVNMSGNDTIRLNNAAVFLRATVEDSSGPLDIGTYPFINLTRTSSIRLAAFDTSFLLELSNSGKKGDQVIIDKAEIFIRKGKAAYRPSHTVRNNFIYGDTTNFQVVDVPGGLFHYFKSDTTNPAVRKYIDYYGPSEKYEVVHIPNFRSYSAHRSHADILIPNALAVGVPIPYHELWRMDEYRYVVGTAPVLYWGDVKASPTLMQVNMSHFDSIMAIKPRIDYRSTSLPWTSCSVFLQTEDQSAREFFVRKWPDEQLMRALELIESRTTIYFTDFVIEERGKRYYTPLQFAINVWDDE